MVAALIDDYDAAFFDLDGVIYLGSEPVLGAVKAIAQLRQRQVALMYVTNNAARSAETVVSHLQSIGFSASLGEVLTSAEVAAEYLPHELPVGSKILIAGSENLAHVIAQAGFVPVYSADDNPVAVLQGYDPEMKWSVLDEATLAVERGVRWYACNNDSSRPSERGTVPGVGGMISVITTALRGAPKVFGKPFLPMLEEAARRTSAQKPVFVGDRLDTDIAGANAAGFGSLLVFTGVHGKADLVAASAKVRPEAIGIDVGALLLPRRVLHLSVGGAKCGVQLVAIRAKKLVIETTPHTVEEQLDALWALANLYWSRPGLNAAEALAGLDLLK